VVQYVCMYDANEKEDKIEEVQESLYSRNTDNSSFKRRHDISEKREPKFQSAWNDEEEVHAPKHTMNIPYTKILIGAFVFFAFALSFTFYKFFIGSNTISGDNINILLSGPSSIAGGEVLPLDIILQNNNSVGLQNVSLDVEYPDGTRQATDLSTAMPRYTEVLGTVNVGANVERLVKAALFGQENSQEVVKVIVQYQTAGSNAIFTKEKDYSVLMSSAPVNISISAPTEVNANQQSDYVVTVTSNSLSVLKGLLLNVTYPFGFSVVSTSPQADSNDNTVFDLGDLAPGSTKTITITGSIAGQDGEQRVLKFAVGTPSTTNSKAVGVPYALYTSMVTLQKSSIGLDLALNQNDSDQIAINPGDKISGEISWTNNLPSDVYNMSVKVQFLGAVIDPTSVNVDNGFFDSSSNTITFDKSNISQLATVNPADEGAMSFDFSSFTPSSNPDIAFGNSAITMNVSVYGSRADAGANPTLLYSDQKVVKLSSNLFLLSRGFKTVGPFTNTGPFPPKVNAPSTYTITWTATNSFNNVDGVTVSAALPANVTWLGVTSPTNANITYNSSTGQILWNIGNMRSGTGDSVPPQDVSFQVSVTPSVTQVGSNITLLNEATINGTDDYSGVAIGETEQAVTTDVTSDPNYVENIGNVTN